MRLDDDVQRFWDECCERTGAAADSLTAVESFGDSPALADELLGLLVERHAGALALPAATCIPGCSRTRVRDRTRVGP